MRYIVFVLIGIIGVITSDSMFEAITFAGGILFGNITVVFGKKIIRIQNNGMLYKKQKQYRLFLGQVISGCLAGVFVLCYGIQHRSAFFATLFIIIGSGLFLGMIKFFLIHRRNLKTHLEK